MSGLSWLQRQIYAEKAARRREKNCEASDSVGLHAAPPGIARALQVEPTSDGRLTAVDQLRRAGTIVNDLAPAKPVRFNQWSNATPAERFEVKVLRQPDPLCDLWQGSGDSDKGYGRFFLDGRKMPAHRAAWILANGPIPEGMQVCHSCDNPACVKVSHLWLGTNADNVRDSVRKGRFSGWTETHCPKGHEATEENVHQDSRGGRICRVCRRDYDRKKTASVKSGVVCGPATDAAPDFGAADHLAQARRPAETRAAASPSKDDRPPAGTGGPVNNQHLKGRRR